MKKFINLETGVVEIPNNEEVIKQYEKYTNLYSEYKEVENEKEPTLNELKEQADNLGITYPKKITKAKLLDLISANETN